MVAVNDLAYGAFNPLVAYAVSCLGAFLGLCCVNRGRGTRAGRRALWLLLAAVSMGGTGVWATHFLVMMGFTISTQQMLYNLPVTVESLILAFAAVTVGLFTVGYGQAGWPRTLLGGVIVGGGAAGMHYLAISGMNMTVRYNMTLVWVSVAIAVAAGTAGLRAGLQMSGIRGPLLASLAMGLAITGMHYTGLAAMTVEIGARNTVTGASVFAYVLPIVLGLGVVTFATAMAIGVTRTPDEIAEEERLQREIAEAYRTGPLAVPVETRVRERARQPAQYEWPRYDPPAPERPRSPRFGPGLSPPDLPRQDHPQYDDSRYEPDSYSQSRLRKTR